jgi:putative drug exporter of the RND superfamily
MSNTHSRPGRRPVIAHLIRTLALPIILLGLLLTVGLHMISPPLEKVADEHSVPMTPRDAPAFKAMMRIGKVFKEFDSDSSAMVVLEAKTNSATAHTTSITTSWPSFGPTPPMWSTSKTSGVTR